MVRFFLSYFYRIAYFLQKKGLDRIPYAIRLFRLINARLQRGKRYELIEVNGQKMCIDMHDKTLSPRLLAHKTIEPYETSLFARSVKEGDIVIDIGAHIGYYTLLAAQRTGKRGKVYAFEPEPRNCELLRKNVLLNGHANVQIFQQALSSKNSYETFHVDSDNFAGHSFSAENTESSSNSIRVKTSTLDSLFSSKRVDLLKMDVQGAEGLVLEGAQRVLKNKKLKMFIEFWPYGLSKAGTDPSRVLKFLHEAKFSIYRIDESLKRLVPLSPKEAATMCNSQKKDFFVNLFAQRK